MKNHEKRTETLKSSYFDVKNKGEKKIKVEVKMFFGLIVSGNIYYEGLFSGERILEKFV